VELGDARVLGQVLALVRELLGTRVELLDVEQAELVGGRCSGHGGFLSWAPVRGRRACRRGSGGRRRGRTGQGAAGPGSRPGDATRAVHGSVTSVLTRVSTAAPDRASSRSRSSAA